MRSRHWALLSERIHMNVKPKANLTFSRCLELGLQQHVDEIAHVAEVASKEYAIEQVRHIMDRFGCDLRSGQWKGLDHCNVLLAGCPAVSLNRLGLVQNAAALSSNVSF